MQEALTQDRPIVEEPVDGAVDRIERRLLMLVGAFIVVNMASLTLARGELLLIDWLSILVWLMCTVSSHTILQRYLPDRDPLILPIVLFLSGWGLIVIDRLAPIFADRQTVWLLISTVALLVTAIFPHLLQWLRNFRYLLLVGGLILLTATIIFGSNPSGQLGAPQLWLGFGNIYFQPSEALKVILVAFLASYLAEQYPLMRAQQEEEKKRLTFSPRIMGPILLMWGLSVIILVWQRDLGTAILFFVAFLILLYVASGSNTIILSGAFLVIVATFAAYNLFAVVEQRVDIWMNPWPEADGRAYQVVQSLMAFSAGGIIGEGVGQGSPTYIPVVHSDFIFAAVAEEWGLVGVIAVIACFFTLIYRGIRIGTQQEERPFYALLSIGLTMLIATQSLLIMGGVLKLIPLTGVTLPFMSYGGSSMLFSFIMVGLLLRLSSNRN